MSSIVEGEGPGSGWHMAVEAITQEEVIAKSTR